MIYDDVCGGCFAANQTVDSHAKNKVLTGLKLVWNVSVAYIFHTSEKLLSFSFPFRVHAIDWYKWIRIQNELIYLKCALAIGFSREEWKVSTQHIRVGEMIIFWEFRFISPSLAHFKVSPPAPLFSSSSWVQSSFSVTGNNKSKQAKMPSKIVRISFISHPFFDLVINLLCVIFSPKKFPYIYMWEESLLQVSYF